MTVHVCIKSIVDLHGSWWHKGSIDVAPHDSTFLNIDRSLYYQDKLSWRLIMLMNIFLRKCFSTF